MPTHNNPAVRRFWAYDEPGGDQPAVLRLEGPIASETWWGDEVTPEAFRAELEAHPGDIEVYINSPGGDVIAGSMIYTMLREHKGCVTVKIAGIAASAASVVAMAGDRVLIAPTAYMMIHNAATFAWGNKNDLQHEAAVLDEVDKGIRTAYRMRTGLSDAKLTRLMDEETWMSAPTAVALGFADAVLGEDDDRDEPDEDDPLTVDPDEDDPERRHDDAMDALAYAMAAMANRQDNDHSLPAVAWSPVQQSQTLLRRVRDKAILDSVDAGKRRMPSLLDKRLIVPEDAPGPQDDEAPESDPTDALRQRLRLLSE